VKDETPKFYNPHINMVIGISRSLPDYSSIRRFLKSIHVKGAYADYIIHCAKCYLADPSSIKVSPSGILSVIEKSS